MTTRKNILSWPDLADKFPFYLAVVMEEIGHDFERTLSVARELGITHVEFGRVWGERADIVPQETLKKAKDLLEKYKIRAHMIAPATFKSVLLGSVPLEHIKAEPHFQEEMGWLKRQLAVAQFFEVPLLRVFSFRREGMIGLGNPSPRRPQGAPFPEEMQEKVARALSLACQEAEKAGVTLALENVRSCWGNSGYNTALILERVNSPWLRVIWDPANAFVSGEEDAYPAGYEAVKPYIALVHLKDAVVVDTATGLIRWERMGDGQVPYLDQLRALKEAGYDGGVSIETHWSPPGGDPESNTRNTYAGLMAILAQLA
jgi:sugar phosphate isomerase/epimerase